MFSPDYETSADSGTSIPFQIAKTPTMTKPPWFNYAAQEYAACREGVAILDYSSFSKFDIWVSVLYDIFVACVSCCLLIL